MDLSHFLHLSFPLKQKTNYENTHVLIVTVDDWQTCN